MAWRLQGQTGIINQQTKESDPKYQNLNWRFAGDTKPTALNHAIESRDMAISDSLAVLRENYNTLHKQIVTTKKFLEKAKLQDNGENIERYSEELKKLEEDKKRVMASITEKEKVQKPEEESVPSPKRSSSQKPQFLEE